jgi:hypothetical protein
MMQVTARQEFITNRAANNWISLSLSLFLSTQYINSTSVESFKAKLDKEMNNLVQVVQ